MKTMKNKFLIIVSLLTISSLVFLGCSKEEPVTAPLNNLNSIENEKDIQKTIQSISDITADYVKSEMVLTDGAKLPGWLKKVFRIVGKDLTGALAGAGGGAAIPGVGPVVGAIVGGVGASLHEAGTLLSSSSNPSSSISTPPLNLQQSINPENVYDYVGAEHVVMLNDKIQANDLSSSLNLNTYYTYSTNNVSAMARQSQAVAGSTVFPISNTLHKQRMINATQCYSLSSLNQTMQFVENNFDDEWPTTFVNNMYGAGKISLYTREILLSYFDGLVNSSSLTSFVEYSKTIERIVSLSSLDEDTKTMLLTTMSTARHDTNFWSKAEF